MPPHERPWRHPSELGPPAHEPTTASGRLLIVSTAALGLLLVGVLAVVATPARDPEVAGPATAEAASSGLASSPVIPFAVPLRPVVVPVAAAGLGLTTHGGGRADARDGQTIDAVLPTGEPVRAVVMAGADDDGIVVVSIPAVATSAIYAVASTAAELGPRDTVAVHGLDPGVVSVADLTEAAVADGTPVTDADGSLIGLCRRDPSSRQTLIVVTDEPLVAAIDGSD